MGGTRTMSWLARRWRDPRGWDRDAPLLQLIALALEEIMIPEEPGTNSCPDGWPTLRRSDTPDGLFASKNWSWERFSRLITVLTGLFLSAVFFVFSNVVGAQRYFPWMLLGVVCGLVLYELARFAVVH